MTSFDWTTAIAEGCTHLAGLGNLPPPAARDPALEAIAVLSLIANAPIRHALTPDSAIPLLTVPRYSGRHDLVDDLLAELTAAVAAPARGNFHESFSPTNWLDQNGFEDLIVRSVQYTADDTGRAALLAHMGSRARDLRQRLNDLRDVHVRQLLERDIPELDAHSWEAFEPSRVEWLLTHQYDADPTRAIRVRRRFQALRLYASIADILREPPISEAIDAGRQLVPILMQRLALTRGQLCALREAIPPAAITSYPCGYRRREFEQTVLRLRAHAIPLHQWPGGGRPGQHGAWSASPWLTMDGLTLIPADYYGADPTTVRDAVRAFADDLLAPLFGELKLPSASDLSPSAILRALTPESLPAIRHYLACVRRALIGPRGPKSFQEAAHVWHRRAAAVAALRHENQTDRPG